MSDARKPRKPQPEVEPNFRYSDKIKETKPTIETKPTLTPKPVLETKPTLPSD